LNIEKCSGIQSVHDIIMRIIYNLFIAYTSQGYKIIKLRVI